MILAIFHIYLYLNLSLQVTQTSFISIHIGLKSFLHAFLKFAHSKSLIYIIDLYKFSHKKNNRI
jgi:hypothetical protein